MQEVKNMKYLAYWGIEDPFGKELPVRHLTKTQDVEQATGCMKFILENGGIGMLTGGTGEGKTTILRNLVENLPTGRYKPAYMNLSTVKGGQFYKVLAKSLGIEPRARKVENFDNIQQRISDLRTKDRITPLLLLDEAQFLPEEVLLDLPLLLNYSMDSRDLAALILCGTPKLSRRLAMEQYEAVEDRITAKYELHGMTSEEAITYIQDRMKMAGGSSRIFDDAAINAAHSSSKGSMRRFNRIMTRALMIGAMEEKREIGIDLIHKAVEDL